MIPSPLQEPFDDLSLEELESRHAEIMNRYRIARITGMDDFVLHQLDIILVNIEEERMRRLIQEETPDGVVLETDPIELIEIYTGKEDDRNKPEDKVQTNKNHR